MTRLSELPARFSFGKQRSKCRIPRKRSITMRSAFVWGIAAFAVTIIMAESVNSKFQASTGPIPLNCNRACLENVVDQYLTALVAKDPKRLPLSADIKYSENDQMLPVGD